MTSLNVLLEIRVELIELLEKLFLVFGWKLKSIHELLMMLGFVLDHDISTDLLTNSRMEMRCR